MSATPDTADWEYEYRPRRSRRWAVAAAVVIVAVHATAGALLRISDTGTRFWLADQIGLGLIGVCLAAAALLFLRPRLRLGPRGVGVTNLAGETIWSWDDVAGIWYSDKGPWARLELPADEHAPLMAIQAVDGEAAVEAMDTFRDYHSRYAV